MEAWRVDACLDSMRDAIYFYTISCSFRSQTALNSSTASECNVESLARDPLESASTPANQGSSRCPANSIVVDNLSFLVFDWILAWRDQQAYFRLHISFFLGV